MKNQILIKDGNHLITLTSCNFFLDYNEESQTLKITQDGGKAYTFRVETTYIPGGKSLEAFSVEITRDIPVFKCI